ncbi:mucin-5AC-like [Rhea pennata]|uniref:mucin-5AC-like n=1 Tax=Rhea pennata TaxID=8795 RepID=UPI002E262B6C
MEGTRRALLRLAAACCLLCALPGEGQKTGETLVTPSPFLSTMPTSHQPGEAAEPSPETTTIPETGSEKNMTAAVANGTGAPAAEESASISTPNVPGTEAEGLQNSSTSSPGDVTVTNHEHHNTSLSVNSSTEIPSSDASTQEENAPGHEGTESSSTTEVGAGSTAPASPPNSVPATTNSSHLGSSDSQIVGSTTVRSGTTSGMSPDTETSTMEPQTTSAPFSTKGSMSSATTSSAATVTLVVTTSTASSTAAVSTSASALKQPVELVHEKASVLDVGDDKNPELPSFPLAETTRADPLVIAVISVFIVMVGILGLVAFLRYRQHNSRMEFRRLQDLPMDDMMEDTPLSLYSY